MSHTYEDIDQASSRTSDRLRSDDAITLSDLYSDPRHTYGGNVKISWMYSIVDWSGLCQKEVILCSVPALSHNRKFAFSSSIRDRVPDSCNMKTSGLEEWTSLKTPKNSFIKGIPDLSLTPPTSVVELPSINEITKRLESEERRIDDPERKKELFTLREAYSTRSIKFRWDISGCVKCRIRQLVFSEEIGN